MHEKRRRCSRDMQYVHFSSPESLSPIIQGFPTNTYIENVVNAHMTCIITILSAEGSHIKREGSYANACMKNIADSEDHVTCITYDSLRRRARSYWALTQMHTGETRCKCSHDVNGLRFSPQTGHIREGSCASANMKNVAHHDDIELPLHKCTHGRHVANAHTT